MTQATLPLEKRTLRKLSAGEMFKLTLFVQGEYVSSKLTDKAFAEKAATFLGFAVSPSSVATARESLEIPSNRDLEREQKKSAVVQMKVDTSILDKFDARLETVEKQVRKLFALSDGTKLEVSDAAIIRKRDELYRTHSAESGDYRAIELVRWALAGGAK